jgi:hypothetical protein
MSDYESGISKVFTALPTVADDDRWNDWDTRSRMVEILPMPEEAQINVEMDFNGEKVMLLTSKFEKSEDGKFSVHQYSKKVGTATVEYTGILPLVAELTSILQSATSESSLYWKVPRIESSEAFKSLGYLENLKYCNKRTEDGGEVKGLIKYLRTAYADIISSWDSMIKNGKIEFDAIWYYFSHGTEVCWTHEETIQGGTVKNCEVKGSLFGKYLEISCNVIKGDSNGLTPSKLSAYIDFFPGVEKISNLDMSIANADIKAKLIERGKHFERLVTQKIAHKSYEGICYRRTDWTTLKYKATGRMMVDLQYYKMFGNPIGENYPRNEKKHAFSVQSESDYFRMYHSVWGFSFVAKQWAEFYVSGISEIKYREDAFDMLVMEPQRKRIIKSLVQNHRRETADFIDQKGGGCIFLLHGPPGVTSFFSAALIVKGGKNFDC